MKQYRYLGRAEKLIHQNKGEIIDCIEGCLLDNLLIETKRGYIALLEKPVTCWTSEYLLTFSEDFQEVDAIFSKIK